MSANERMPDALVDFDSAIRFGTLVQDALEQSAAANDVRADVLRVRAARQFGDLELYRERCLQVSATHQKQQAALEPLRAAIDEIYNRPKAFLRFIPIGNFIRQHFPEGTARDEAFEFARNYQRKLNT